MTTAEATHAIAPGDLIDGRYRIISLLGEGGMGAVFLAEHTGLSKEVALKVIHPSFAGDGEIRARFTREAMASARIDHPHVASALDIGTLPEGSAYLVMPLVRGPSLADVLDRGPMPWPHAVAIAAQIADALDAAHTAGIVHRDLKPDNVVLVPREDGRDHVKVLDFGIAGLSGEDPALGRPLTRVGVVMGTPGYMSPEQAIGETVDIRTDLYALGVIIWEAIVGRPLFEGNEVTGIVTKQLTTTVTPLRELESAVPPELDALVSSLLARAREERPARAADVRDILVSLLPQMRQSLIDTMPMAREASQRTFTHGATALGNTRRATAASGPLALVAELRARLSPAMDLFLGLSTKLRIVAIAVPLLFVVVLSRSCDEDEPEVASAPQAVVVQTPAGPVIVERPLAVPSGTNDAATQVPAPTPAPRTLDANIENAISTLVTNEDRALRQAAATAITAATTTPVPEFARAVAELELARGCGERKAALVRITEIADVRALPYVQRMDALPRRGCGFLSSRDCHSCIRRDISNALRALGSDAPSGAE